MDERVHHFPNAFGTVSDKTGLVARFCLSAKGRGSRLSARGSDRTELRYCSCMWIGIRMSFTPIFTVYKGVTYI